MTGQVFLDRLEALLIKQGELYTRDDIIEAIEAGRMQGFVRNDTWVVTQVSAYPRRKVLDILLLVGEIEDARALEPQIVKFGRDAGATQIRTLARDGWKADADVNGWSVAGQVYQKDI